MTAMEPTHSLYTDEGRQEVTFVREGCATGWDKCPHGEHARTVVFAGETMTSCVHDHDLATIVRAEDLPTPTPAKPRVPLARDVQAAEASWGSLASQYGDNLATVRARGRWQELKAARAERRKVEIS